MVAERKRQAAENPRQASEKVASGCAQMHASLPKQLVDHQSRDFEDDALSRNWGRIENGPGHMVLEHRPGPDLNPGVQTENEADLTLPDLTSLPREEAQKRAIEGLESIRKLRELYNKNKPPWLLFARECGLSHAEIAVVLGITEPTVRQAVKRANDAQTEGRLHGGE